MSSEKFCLRWNDFESNISVAFRELREDKDFFDVTLACDDEQIEAHKVILSACSPFFRQVLRKNPHQHPLLYLKGVKFTDLQSVLNFMYHGEVNIAQEELNSFLSVAEELRVKGLTQGQQPGGSTQTNSQASHKPPTPAPAFKPRPPDPPQRPRAARPPQEVQNEEPEVQAVEMPSVKSEMVAQGEYEGVMEEEEEEGSYQDEYGEQFLGDGQEYNVMQQHDPSKGRKALEEYLVISQEQGFQCGLCQKAFNRKGHALNHLENVHFPQAFEYPCKQCQQVFSSKNQLYKHVHKEHRQFYPNS